MEKVFIVQFDWSTPDAESVDLYAFTKYEDAYDKFKELICAERNPEMSWVGDIEFDEGGYPIEDHYDSSSKTTTQTKAKFGGISRIRTIGINIRS